MSGQLEILVVDDNRTAAEAIALLLEREGHHVEACFDGRSAIERLSERHQSGAHFDLVLTDLRMQPVDGLGVVRAARRLAPPVDVMVFTAFGSVEAAVEVSAAAEAVVEAPPGAMAAVLRAPVAAGSQRLPPGPSQHPDSC